MLKEYNTRAIMGFNENTVAFGTGVTPAALLYSRSGSLARVTPRLLFGLKHSCRSVFAISFRAMVW